MKHFKYPCLALLLICGVFILSSFLSGNGASFYRSMFPYKKSGLTEREAAAHLLSRFTYGATPGEVDQVVKMGLEKWFVQQLDGEIPDDSLDKRLDQFSDLKLSNAQIVQEFPNGGKVIRMAIRDGYINKDSVNKADKGGYRDTIAKYMQMKGLKPGQELYRQFINQKILRAAYTNNQLREVMTDFWFNHFNVSLTKGDCALFIPDYERDVIRPNVFGKFDNLLLATAKSPAMLFYLDNFTSTGANNAKPLNPQASMMLAARLRASVKDSVRAAAMVKNIQKVKKVGQGLNENYAREVMELHTLGVDGGYTQQDVTQAARVLTGWTIYPMDNEGYGGGMRKILDRIGEDKLAEKGFVHEGDFLFAVNRHDDGEKVVLGHHFKAGGGYQEGVDLLEMLAHHPSTARFISRKLAVRFVSDNPPQSLINKMAKTFIDKDGDIKQVLITMVSSPEFWSPSALREKTKSPFELAINSVRSLNANIIQPYQLFNWLNRMGERIYYYQAPTGFPDKGQYWINTGSLLSRMNFGLALAANRIPGVRVDLAGLNNHHEPESAQAALVTYCKIIMPERNLDQTIKRLTPMLSDPQLAQKIANASKKAAPLPNAAVNAEPLMKEDTVMKRRSELSKNNYMVMQPTPVNNNMLSQVVGVIIGSPEFQRR